MKYETSFSNSDVLESPIVYSVLVHRDGSEVYEIHKNRINGRQGIVASVEFDYIKSQIDHSKRIANVYS